MKSSGWALIEYDWCPYTRKFTQRDEFMKLPQEGGHLQAKERGLRGNSPFGHLDLGLPASRTERKSVSVI